jgi:activator of HSP90 ATPase
MSDFIEVSAFFPGLSAERMYYSWLDSAAHSAFTGSPAQIDNRVGGLFTAWDGYISGQTLEMQPFQRIVQSWRTTEFPEDSPDSRLEITIIETETGTKVELSHSNIPAGQGENYRQGWEEFYFVPMRSFFAP